MTHYWWREAIGRDYAHAYRVSLIYEEHTPAGQHLQVLKNPLWGRLVVLDGIVQFTERDEFVYHETIVFTPLAALKGPVEKVLIIGGGDGGVLRELQKFPEIKEIFQAELDFSVFKACQKYFPELTGDYGDPRLRFEIMDGLKAVKEFPEEAFQVVIVDCTDPVGPARSLYTEEFYQGLYRVLSPEGVFIQQASLPGLFPHILKEAFGRARKVFSHLKVLRAMVPCYGDEIAFLLGGKQALPSEPQRLLEGRYYHPGLYQASLTLPRWWEKELLS